MLTQHVVPDFTALCVGVVGDLIADHYLYTVPTRLSREAAVMVLRHRAEAIGAGGAANVARNLWSLGARTFLIGAVGRDANGRELVRILEHEQIEVDAVQAVAGWVTPTKTRVLGAEPGRTPQQVVRIDREPDKPLDGAVSSAAAQAVRALAGRVDALLISDYGYGLCSEGVAEAAREVQASGAVVVLDPRRDFAPFCGVTAMTPNLSELALATGRDPETLSEPADITRAANELLERFEPRWLLVTLGNRGMALYSREARDGVTVRAAGSESVIDVSGAGDTAAVAFTLGLAAGLEGPRAMRLANAASGVVVMEQGAVVCQLSKLRSALTNAPLPVFPKTATAAG